MFEVAKKLSAKGIIGMNRRNIGYIGKYNSRKLYPLVDDKLKTKIIAEEAGITVPKLLGTIEYQFQNNEKYLKKIIGDLSGFVIKPSKGSGGKGILVITGREGDTFFRPSGQPASFQDVVRHISNTLSGLYSLGGKPDIAMVEALVEFDPVFDRYSFEGVPDIRMIVFKGFPVMGMLRCSTRASDGKANLHQGAVGVGLDIGSGTALNAVQFDKPIDAHPDTKHSFKELAVPHWDDLLPLSASCYDITNLGYLGVDIVLDKKIGPMILELNARPGLAIQIANNCGLLPRLKKIEALPDEKRSVEQRIEYSVREFGVVN
jgi:alpha-L-glutamate ligase-like protein